jgi:hypothetical protein
MSREADLEKANKACNELLRQLAHAQRQAGKACDIDDFPARAEWSYLRAKATPDRQYQIYIDATFSMSGDETGVHVVSTALVASGRTVVDAMEMFHNWATDAAEDPRVIAIFRDKALRGEQAERDAAKDAAEQLADAAATSETVRAVKERTQEWLAKKFDFMARKRGAIGRKVQL